MLSFLKKVKYLFSHIDSIFVTYPCIFIIFLILDILSKFQIFQKFNRTFNLKA